MEIARQEIDWRAQRIRYRDVSKGELKSAGDLGLFIHLLAGGSGGGRLTSHRELAVELGVHLFVSLVAPYFVHGLPHHRHGHHEALSGGIGEQSQTNTSAAFQEQFFAEFASLTFKNGC